MFRALLAHPQEALHKRRVGELCAVVDVGWSQDVGRRQSCVVPPEDGQVMRETCRHCEPQ
jgi:hypothetical protein